MFFFFFVLFDVPEKLCHVFSRSLWSRSSLRRIAIRHSAPRGHSVTLHMSGFHVAALDAVFDLPLQWAWRIKASPRPHSRPHPHLQHLDSHFQHPNMWNYYCFFFSFICITRTLCSQNTLPHENNPLADPVSYALRTTREHQSVRMYARQRRAWVFEGVVTLAARKISKQMRVALSSQGFWKCRNNRQRVTGEL